MKKVLLSALMALISIGSQAQQTIDVFKTVKLPPMDGITLVTVNKAKFNIYEKPNGKRRAEPWGAPGEYIVEYGPSLFGVKMHPTGWAYIFSGSESGFASPKDFHKANLTPFKDWMFNTAEASFNDGHFINTWRIGINKATGLALKIWGIEKSRQNLGIGRLKDNALVVILNTVLIEPKYQESQNTINIIQKKDESENVYYEIIYGKNNSIKTNRGIRLNLETIPEAILAKLFLPVNEGFGEYREIVKEWKDIEYSQWDGIDYYNDAVNAELMSAPYVDEQTAINAFKATAPANQTGDTDMLTTIENQIAAAKKKVQENPSAESYYELANILYYKYTKINDDSEKNKILAEIDNTYMVIIDKYPQASAAAVLGRASVVNLYYPDIKQGAPKLLYEKYLQMIEPKVKNKTYNEEEKNGYLAACLYLYRYYAEQSDFKQVKYYLMKYDAMEPGNENIRKMIELVKDY